MKNIVNSSAELAKNYVEQTRNSIETDILLVILDINNQSALYYENPNLFKKLLTSQRLLRRLDEVYLLDSAGTIIMSNITASSYDFIPPPDDAFIQALDGKDIYTSLDLEAQQIAYKQLNNRSLSFIKFKKVNISSSQLRKI